MSAELEVTGPDDGYDEDGEPLEAEESTPPVYELTYVTHRPEMAVSIHRYVDGYEIWMSPAFGADFAYEDFDLHFGDEPWEMAARDLIVEAAAPIDRLEVGPDRVIAIYKERFNTQSEVVTWSLVEEEDE